MATVASLTERLDALLTEFRRLRATVTGNGQSGLVVAVDRNTRWRVAQTWVMSSMVLCLLGVGGKLLTTLNAQTIFTEKSHVVESSYVDVKGFTRTARVDKSEAPDGENANAWMVDELARREAAMLLKWPKAN